MKKTIWAIAACERRQNLKPSTSGFRIVERLKDLRKDHTEKGAAPFDILKSLPFIRQCIFSDNHPDPVRKANVEQDPAAPKKPRKQKKKKNPEANPFKTVFLR